MTRSAGVLTTGSYLPKDKATNQDVASWVAVTTKWTVRKPRILIRRFMRWAAGT